MAMTVLPTLVGQVFNPHGPNVAKCWIRVLKRKAMHTNCIARWGHWCAPHQDKLEDSFSPTDFDLSKRCGAMLTSLCAAFVFAAGCPIVAWLAFATFLVMFWCDTYVLITDSEKPPQYDAYIVNATVARVVPLGIFIHAIIGVWMFGNQTSFPSKVWNEDQQKRFMDMGESLIGPRDSTPFATYANIWLERTMYEGAVPYFALVCISGGYFVYLFLVWLANGPFSPLLIAFHHCLERMGWAAEEEVPEPEPLWAEIKEHMAEHGHINGYNLTDNPKYSQMMGNHVEFTDDEEAENALILEAAGCCSRKKKALLKDPKYQEMKKDIKAGRYKMDLLPGAGGGGSRGGSPASGKGGGKGKGKPSQEQMFQMMKAKGKKGKGGSPQVQPV